MVKAVKLNNAELTAIRDVINSISKDSAKAMSLGLNHDTWKSLKTSNKKIKIALRKTDIHGDLI